MFNGTQTHYVQKFGTRSVHVIPNDDEECFDIYFQKKFYPLSYVFGLPYVKRTGDRTDLDECFEVAWNCFDEYEKEMFK